MSVAFNVRIGYPGPYGTGEHAITSVILTENSLARLGEERAIDTVPMF